MILSAIIVIVLGATYKIYTGKMYHFFFKKIAIVHEEQKIDVLKNNKALYPENMDFIE